MAAPRRLPANAVWRAIQATGGPSAVCLALGISLATLARWRKVGRVIDARAVLTWAALLEPDDAGRQLRLAGRLAGVRPRTDTAPQFP